MVLVVGLPAKDKDDFATVGAVLNSASSCLGRGSSYLGHHMR